MSSHTVQIRFNVLVETKCIVQAPGDRSSCASPAECLGSRRTQSFRNREARRRENEGASCRIEHLPADIGRCSGRSTLMRIVGNQTNRQPRIELHLELSAQAKRLVRTGAVAQIPVVLRIYAGKTKACIFARTYVEGAFNVVGVIVAIASRSIAGSFAELGLGRQQIDGTCSCVSTVERSLRPLQHLHAVQIEQGTRG